MYIIKVVVLIGIFSLFHALFARLRIDQMINFCWKYMVPVGILQMLICLLLKGILKS